MAMTRKMAIVVMMAFALGCGDAAEGDNGHEPVVECEGEHLKLNYRECVGDKAYREKNGETITEMFRRNDEHVDPTADDTVLGCEGSPPPETVAHYCNYKDDQHAGKCIWMAIAYQNQDGGIPITYCQCGDWTSEPPEVRCD